MSDFIKVNFKNGLELLVNRREVRIATFANKYYYYDVAGRLGVLADIFSSQHLGIGKSGSDIFDILESEEISREEYDRLCKELGIEE